MWDEYRTLGVFTILNTIYLGIILWFGEVAWLLYIAVFLIILAFATQFNYIKKHNKHLRRSSARY